MTSPWRAFRGRGAKLKTRTVQIASLRPTDVGHMFWYFEAGSKDVAGCFQLLCHIVWRDRDGDAKGGSSGGNEPLCSAAVATPNGTLPSISSRSPQCWVRAENKDQTGNYGNNITTVGLWLYWFSTKMSFLFLNLTLNSSLGFSSSLSLFMSSGKV